METEYDLLGYSIFKMNDEDARIKYGKYTLDLYYGPIYCEDWEEGEKA